MLLRKYMSRVTDETRCIHPTLCRVGLRIRVILLLVCCNFCTSDHSQGVPDCWHQAEPHCRHRPAWCWPATVGNSVFCLLHRHLPWAFLALLALAGQVVSLLLLLIQSNSTAHQMKRSLPTSSQCINPHQHQLAAVSAAPSYASSLSSFENSNVGYLSSFWTPFHHHFKMQSSTLFSLKFCFLLKMSVFLLTLHLLAGHLQWYLWWSASK